VAVAEGPGRGGDLRLGLDAEYLTQEAGNEAVPGATDLLDQSTLRLTAVYSPWASLNLVAAVPFTRKRMTLRQPDGSTAPSSDLSGLGDAEVGVRWFLLERAEVAARRRQGLAVSLGLLLPTGEGAARDASGALVDQHGQLGSGAWGGSGALTYRLQVDPWSLTASVGGRLRGENAQGYHYGNALVWTVQGQWSPWDRLALGVALDGRSAAADRDPAGEAANTGGVVLAVTPSAYLGVGGGLWLTARAQLPVVSQLLGEQRVGPTVLVGLAWQAG
jgi:hypothetical protein